MAVNRSDEVVIEGLEGVDVHNTTALLEKIHRRRMGQSAESFYRQTICNIVDSISRRSGNSDRVREFQAFKSRVLDMAKDYSRRFRDVAFYEERMTRDVGLLYLVSYKGVSIEAFSNFDLDVPWGQLEDVLRGHLKGILEASEKTRLPSLSINIPLAALVVGILIVLALDLNKSSDEPSTPWPGQDDDAPLIKPEPPSAPDAPEKIFNRDVPQVPSLKKSVDPELEPDKKELQKPSPESLEDLLDVLEEVGPPEELKQPVPKEPELPKGFGVPV